MRFFVLASLLLLSACSLGSSQVEHHFTQINPNDRTVIVQPGGQLTSLVANRLLRMGWRVVPNTAQGMAAEGTLGQPFSTGRYQLIVQGLELADTFPCNPRRWKYYAAMLDRISGYEVVRMEGDDCENNIPDRFQDALEKQYKTWGVKK